jgi:diketogulonate reductase-like aldo/keto reductase
MTKPTIPTHNANGASIPVIGLGTFSLKGAECSAIVERAIALGYRHIDTAIMYDNEEAVGEGIRASGIAREDLFVTSKVWPTNVREGVFQKEVEGTLARLGLDYLDLALIHWPPKGSVEMGKWMGLLNDVADRGMARNIGVSNFPTEMLNMAVATSERPLATNQIENHPYLDESRVKVACHEHGVAPVAYCPIFRGGALFEEDAIAGPASRHGKTQAQIVLRWHIQKGGIAIPKTATPARLEENIDIFDFELTGDEIAAIDALGSRNARLCQWDGAPQWDVVYTA